MKISNKALKVLSNVQIWSALIWAAVIIGCSYFTNSKEVSTILIAAAGIHVVLLSTILNKKNVVLNKQIQ